MAAYNTCPHCGAHLDFNEKCDCLEIKDAQIKHIKSVTDQEVDGQINIFANQD